MAFDLTHVRFDGVGRRRQARAPAPEPPTSAPSGEQPSSGPATPLVRRVLEHEGLDPDAYRARPLERRVQACLRSLRAASGREALDLLESGAASWDAAADALLIGVTSFFRDAPVFDAIRSLVIPAVTRRPRIRAWSVACSTGEELYSLAMLLADAGALSRSELLGTDCRRQAVARAEEGCLAPAAAAEMDAGLWARYVEDRGSGPRVAAALRCRCRWKVRDVLAGSEEGPWDIILWRNSPMYLAAETSGGVFARLADALAPAGYLVVGKAERPPAGLPLSVRARCVYVRRGDRDGMAG
jgi:chemotaxis methyl-accepting protein methylase